jgi:hypothetical protein
MILALLLADEPGPVFARGTTLEGRPVRAAWCSPWLAVERVGKIGRKFGRASEGRRGCAAARKRPLLTWATSSREEGRGRSLPRVWIGSP